MDGKKSKLIYGGVGKPGDAETQALKFCFNPIQIKKVNCC
jgi:hypothetical protein